MLLSERRSWTLNREAHIGRREREAETTYMELREKHGSKYDAPRLRLWARMISTGLHSDYDTPRNTCIYRKRSEACSKGKFV